MYIKISQTLQFHYELLWETMFLQCFLVGETHHLLVRQLPPLNAAAVPHCLLVPLTLNVTEQVDLRGDLQTQTHRPEIM